MYLQLLYIIAINYNFRVSPFIWTIQNHSTKSSKYKNSYLDIFLWISSKWKILCFQKRCPLLVDVRERRFNCFISYHVTSVNALYSVSRHLARDIHAFACEIMSIHNTDTVILSEKLPRCFSGNNFRVHLTIILLLLFGLWTRCFK